MSDMDGPVRPDSPVEYYPVKYVEQYKKKIQQLHLELAKAQDCNALFDENKRLRMRIAELEQEKRAREATEAWETSLLRKQATQGYMYQNPESRLPSRSHMTPVTMAMEVTPLKPPGSPSKMVTVTVAMPEPLVNGVSHSSILNSFGSSPRDHNNSSSSGVIIKPLAQQVADPVASSIISQGPISSTATRRISAPITSMPIRPEPLHERKFVPHMPSAQQPLLTSGVGLKPMPISAQVNLSNAKPRVAHQTATATPEPELPSATDEPLRMTGVVLPPSLISASHNSTSAPARTIARQNSKPESRPTPPKQPQKSLSAVVSSLNNKRKASSESNNPLAKLKKRALSTAAKNNQPVGIFKPEPKKAFSEMFSKEKKKPEPAKKPEPVKKTDEPAKKKPARKGRSDEWIAEKIKELVVKYDYDFDKIPAADFITKAKQCQYSKNLCMKRAREMIAAKKKEDEEKEEEEELDTGAADLDKLLGLSASDSSSSDGSSSSESEDEAPTKSVQKDVTTPNDDSKTETAQDKHEANENDVLGSIFQQVEQRPDMVMTPLQKRPVKTGITAPLGPAPSLDLDKNAIKPELASASNKNNSSELLLGEVKSSNDQKATNTEKSSELMEVDSSEKISEEEEADIQMKIAQVANEDNEEKKRRMSAALIDQCGLNLDSDESDDEQGSLEIATNDVSAESAALAIDEDSQSSEKSELFIDDPTAQVPTATESTNETKEPLRMTGVVLPPSLLAAVRNGNQKSATQNSTEQEQDPMEIEIEDQSSVNSLQLEVCRVPSESGTHDSRLARRSTRNSTRIALKKSGETDPQAQDAKAILPAPKETLTSKTAESPTKATPGPEAPVEAGEWNPEVYENFVNEDKKKALLEQLNKYPQLKCLKNFQQRSYVLQMRNCLAESICIRQIDDPDIPRKVLDMPKAAKDYLMLIPQKNLLQLVLLTRDIKHPGERDGDFEIILQRIREQILEITDNFPHYEVSKLEEFAQIEGLFLMLLTMLKSQIKSRKDRVYFEMHRFTLFLAHLISKTQIPDKKCAGPNSAIVFYIFCLMSKKIIPEFFLGDVISSKLLNFLPYLAILEYAQEKHDVYIGKLHFYSTNISTQDFPDNTGVKLKNTKEMHAMMNRIKDAVFAIRRKELSLGINSIQERSLDSGRDAFQLLVNVKSYEWAKKLIKSVFTRFIITFSGKNLNVGGFSDNLSQNEVEHFVLQVHSFYAYLKCYGRCKDPVHESAMGKLKVLLSELSKCKGTKTEQACLIANEAIKVVQGFKLCDKIEWNREIQDLNKKVAKMRVLSPELLYRLELPLDFYEREEMAI